MLSESRLHILALASILILSNPVSAQFGGFGDDGYGDEGYGDRGGFGGDDYGGGAFRQPIGTGFPKLPGAPVPGATRPSRIRPVVDKDDGSTVFVPQGSRKEGMEVPLDENISDRSLKLPWLDFRDQTSIPGPCPKVDPMDEMDHRLFLGEWTVNRDSNVTNMDYNTDVTVTYRIGLYGELEMNVKKDRCEREIDNFYVPWFWTTHPSIQKFADFQNDEDIRILTRTLVKTDNTRYAVEYFCEEFRGSHREFWHYLTRDRCEMSEVEYESFYNILDQYGIDTKIYSEYGSETTLTPLAPGPLQTRAINPFDLFKKWATLGQRPTYYMPNQLY